ncbi:Relaxase/Mobilisation nuclease domain [Sphingobacterium multivorum]|uniref:relaxase/mobilization nuclease domain-containing protein n=1 Tax=Sphingobacterium multivorum TaxID=28454 RepID=UPI000E010769|nr:relaxase/mobilization nuclease domain-containing protein [Sphingobacterium multivorum]QQT46071.1 relaxase/mobilization nuclease domain-containing protein [Sphingobacterium multivorum]SUJ30786.1 Relaxase/Mobilisation nuclease domain [Sphingobacterium multivorum]
MVAVIKTGHSIRRIFNYNENKVEAGIAQCIGAGNYPADPDRLSYSAKLNCFLRQLGLNENVTRNSVHISLNFHASETDLGTEKLMEIASDYMDKIGFGEQPFLVYQHFDAGHPHIHIVSIKVRGDGSRIDMNNIGRNESEQARKSIEKEFGLVNAEAQKKEQQYVIKPISAAKAIYGKSQTKMAIQNVLDLVLDQYRYASLPELNAVLRQYNVTAERGSEDSLTYRRGGLLYRILDGYGKTVGVPIKASLFYSQPTLKNLQERYRRNDSARRPYKARIKNAADMALLNKHSSIEELGRILEKQGIILALRKNEAGIVYGITYIDHQTRCVFNGSALGKQYSAKAIQERCLPKEISAQELLVHQVRKQTSQQQQDSARAADTKTPKIFSKPAKIFSKDGTIIDELMQSEQVNDHLPQELRKDKKRRKKRNLNNNS